MWELAPGRAWIADVLAEGDTLWFALEQPCTSGQCTEAWLIHTNADGEQLQPPAAIYSANFARYPALAITDTTIVATYSLDGVVMARHFDRAGIPIDDSARPIALRFAGDELGTYDELALTTNGPDRVRMAFPPANPTFPGAVATVDLDAQGNALGDVVPLGTREDGWTNTTIAAMGDGSTLVAWGHSYDPCHPPYRSGFTLTAPVAADGSVGVTAPVRDLPERDEASPALASSDGASYVAWQSDWYSGVSLARYPDLEDVALIGIPDVINVAPVIALADADHGAIAWLAENSPNDSVMIAPFSYEGGHVVPGKAHALPYVATPAARSPSGLVYIGGGGYVVTFSETTDVTRSYAMHVDFDAPSPSLAPASSIVGSAQEPPRVRPLRCSH